jgi:hypothetical protein
MLHMYAYILHPQCTGPANSTRVAKTPRQQLNLSVLLSLQHTTVARHRTPERFSVPQLHNVRHIIYPSLPLCNKGSFPLLHNCWQQHAQVLLSGTKSKPLTCTPLSPSLLEGQSQNAEQPTSAAAASNACFRHAMRTHKTPTSMWTSRSLPTAVHHLL